MSHIFVSFPFFKSYGGCHDPDTHRRAVRRAVRHPEARGHGYPERYGHH